MTRKQKIAKAKVLQGQGLDCQRIAEELGVPHRKTVWAWLNPEAQRRLRKRENARRKEAVRVWRDQHRASCETCGKPLRAGSASPSVRGKTGLCKKCLGRLKAKRNESRRAEARRLYRGGTSPQEIANRLGVARSTAMKWTRPVRREVPA